MRIQKLLIANRGEVAVRIARAAHELGIPCVAIYSEDDASCMHVRVADEAVRLPGTGPRAYLDIERIIQTARTEGCDAIHPGYGLLAESPVLARNCAEAGITFVGPPVEAMELFGDKGSARALARNAGVPVLPGTEHCVSLKEAREFFASLASGEASDQPAMVIKAVAGGGGRGLRVVTNAEEIAEAYARCQSEAKAAFGDDGVIVEQLLQRARHIEVQLAGDSEGNVCHLGERECTIQRRHQKLVEIAPSPWLAPALRDSITAAAMKLGQVTRYENLGTFEFLVDEQTRDFYFIEANPRLQVEHTVTEEVTGIDLVQLQLRLAGGESLQSLGLGQQGPSPRGYALQARVNTERMTPDGDVFPSSGVITVFEPPLGPGVRVDTHACSGYATNPNFDSLLAKVIVHSASSDFNDVLTRTGRVLGDFGVGGLQTNLAFLRNIVAHEEFRQGDIHTTWVDQRMRELAVDDSLSAPRKGLQSGATIDRRDPLSSLDFFRGGEPTRGAGRAAAVISGPPNTSPVTAPLQGTVTEVQVAVGEAVRQGQQLFVMSALKMEHIVKAPIGGLVREVTVEVEATVYEGHPLAFIEEMDVGEAIAEATREVDVEYVPPSLQAVFDRRTFTLDEKRPEAVERRHSKGRLTVRENIEQLIDPGTWVEYGALTIAGQRARRSLDELIRKTPADGLVAGIGSVNGDVFDEKRARTMFISYDDTVLAGTQGVRGHDKTDRMVDLANELSLPLIFHAEGAGGRSGDTETVPSIHPAVRTFEKMAQLSGKVPMIGVTAGWCYAGNAAILGLTDVIIATEDSLIAMGGPATIEGGGLGAFLPEEVGPISDLAPAGTVDIVVKDHAEAIAASKKCLSYFQGSIKHWECEDQRLLRHVIPENRKRAFDIREIIRLLADKDSVLELRPDFGISMVTAFVRIEGHPFGLTANNNAYIGGAIDSPGSDKVARFWQLCDAFNIPIITLVDTPGMMVGPEVEKTGLIRHCARLFVTGANLESPRFAVVLRKGYALGSISVMTGSSRAPVFTVGWPDSEYGGMNVEAGVLLSHRDALAEIADVEERAAEYQRLLDGAYERLGALNSASVFGIDDVIDPAETRKWIAEGLRSVPESEPLRRGRRTFLDTW